MNYARWGFVNVAEGLLLKEETSQIYKALTSTQAAVLKSDWPCIWMWHDMGIDQYDQGLCKVYLPIHQRKRH